MNAREILIMNTKDQGKYRVVTDAATLGELKSILARNEGVFKKVGNEWISNPTPINISDMGFTEGITKAEYSDGSALIPETVPFKGGMSSPVFLLTNTTKKIASGAVQKYNRKDLYTKIKLYSLEETVKARFGKNFTMVSSADLAAIIDEVVAGEKTQKLNYVREELTNVGTQEEKKEEEAVNTPTPETKLPEVKTAPHASTVNWLYDGIKTMAKENTLYVDDVIVLAGLVKELAYRLYEERPVVTDDDLEDMLDDIMG